MLNASIGVEPAKPCWACRAEPDELAAVELRRSGATLQAIAQALNAEGLPTKRGAVWRAGTVRAVLMRAG